MDKFLIKGPCKIKGQVSISGSKNAALPILASTILFDKTVIIENLPRVKDIDTMLKLLKSLGSKIGSGLEELTLTTNGSQLSRFSDQLYDYGVRRVNVSIDTLNPELFKKITRWGDLEKVLVGLKSAKKAGLKCKINAVALKGVNENELQSMIEWAHNEGHDFTIIETMPMGEITEDRTDQYLPLSMTAYVVALEPV